MKKGWIILVVAAVLIVGGVAIYLMSQQNGTATETNNSETQQETSSSGTDEDASADVEQVSTTTIVLSDDGFDKTSYTVKAGDTVTVKNESSSAMQFSSDDHPTHFDHPEINMAVVEPGQSGTFVAETVGTYGFHDHLNEQHTGTLVVE